MDLELADKVRALADEFEAMYGPSPNGFQRFLPIKGESGVVARLRALIEEDSK